jgi:hypothetical protein
MPIRQLLTYIASIGALFIAAEVAAADFMSTHLTYQHRLTSRDVAPLTDDAFGDQISLADGTVSFVQTDISLPTNSGMPVRLGRRTPTVTQRGAPAFSPFGEGWELDVPHMMATHDERSGWNAGGSTANRCTSANKIPVAYNGPWPDYHTTRVPPHLYWNGISIHLPGAGTEQMLNANSAQPMPQDGHTYVGTTKAGWRVRCLDALRRGSGEGFVVLTPDGKTYEFDWMELRNAPDLVLRNGLRDEYGESMDSWTLLTPRVDVFIFATKVTDRFGNWIKYTYDPIIPGRLLSIHSSDNADHAVTVRIDIEYVGDRAVRAKANGRTWTYGYSPDNKRLASITLPDASQWKFEGALRDPAVDVDNAGFYTNRCAEEVLNWTSAAATPRYPHTYKITHPSGATAEYAFRAIMHGTNNTPGECVATGDLSSLSFVTFGIPSASGRMSLERKTISGNSLETRIWQYTYFPSWSFEKHCGNGCPTTSRTQVATNDGVSREYTFGNDYYTNVGQLLKETVARDGAIYRQVSYAYVATSVGQPFPDNAGDIMAEASIAKFYGNPFTTKNRPPLSTSETVDSRRFTRTVDQFDARARPLRVTETNQAQ